MTNDQRVAAAAYRRGFVSVLEVQETAPDGQMVALDLFHPEKGRILLIDRTVASEVCRFTLLFSWFLPLPHYTRISGVSAVHVARETLEMWKADLEHSFEMARRTRPDLTRDEYLASTFYVQIQRMAEIGKEWQASLLRKVDFCRAVARYKLKAPFPEILAVLSAKPELETTAPVAGDGFDNPFSHP